MIPREPTFSLDWAPDAVIVTSPDRTIVHLNPRAEHLFGYRCGEVAERPLEMLIVEGLPRVAATAALQQTSRRVLCVHRDGTRFAAAARWRPAPSTAGSYMVLSVREAATAERRGTFPSDDSPDEPSRGDLDLLTLFTHDVRQSLQAIQFICDTLDDKAPDQAATIGEIVAAIGRLLDRLGRVGNLDLSPAPEPSPGGPLLGELAPALGAVAAQNGIALLVDDSSERRTTPPVLFRELLHNLMSNAIRYTASGRVEVRCRAGGPSLRIEIADTGPGFEPSGLDAVLAERSTRASTLGLAIVRQLAERLGCAIEIDSAPGRGSCFTVVAPRAGV